LYSFLLYSSRHHRDLHSFPTRRSSDLSGVTSPLTIFSRVDLPSPLRPRRQTRSPGSIINEAASSKGCMPKARDSLSRVNKGTLLHTPVLNDYTVSNGHTARSLVNRVLPENDPIRGFSIGGQHSERLGIDVFFTGIRVNSGHYASRAWLDDRKPHRPDSQGTPMIFRPRLSPRNQDIGTETADIDRMLQPVIEFIQRCLIRQKHWKTVSKPNTTGSHYPFRIDPSVARVGHIDKPQALAGKTSQRPIHQLLARTGRDIIPPNRNLQLLFCGHQQESALARYGYRHTLRPKFCLDQRQTRQLTLCYKLTKLIDNHPATIARGTKIIKLERLNRDARKRFNGIKEKRRDLHSAHSKESDS